MLRTHVSAKFGFFSDKIELDPGMTSGTTFSTVIVLVSFVLMINLCTRQKIFHKLSFLKALPSMLNSLVFLGI